METIGRIEPRRLARALALVAAGQVREVESEGGRFRAVVNGGREAVIDLWQGQARCSCPDFLNRGVKEGMACKHILALAASLGLLSVDPDEALRRAGYRAFLEGVDATNLDPPAYIAGWLQAREEMELATGAVCAREVEDIPDTDYPYCPTGSGQPT